MNVFDNMMIPQINMNKTGENIHRLINEKGFSIKDIQRICGFSTPQSIYKWINGKSIPSIDNLVILSDMFDCTINEILAIEKGN